MTTGRVPWTSGRRPSCPSISRNLRTEGAPYPDAVRTLETAGGITAGTLARFFRILIPANLTGGHWVLFVVQPSTTWDVHLYDPLQLGGTAEERAFVVALTAAFRAVFTQAVMPPPPPRTKRCCGSRGRDSRVRSRLKRVMVLFLLALTWQYFGGPPPAFSPTLSV